MIQIVQYFLREGKHFESGALTALARIGDESSERF